ncbi:MAG: tRNA nucleotidyltransferase [Magnetovibrio sp.]|nr:tRNA nucleotidyltransferase [Magnetovibrio sp.]
MNPRNKRTNIGTTIGSPHWFHSTQTRKVIKALRSEGAEVRFVGGCIRDTLANRPVKDIDLATPTIPDDIIKLLEKYNIRALPTGIQHGTITAVCEQKAFQITTLRKDKKTDGRHAEVVFTDDWASDSRRRDFTINSLSADLRGIVYDYNDGIVDLKHGRVRFIGSAQNRIDEDYLRILRFFRFQGEYGQLPIDSDVLRVLGSRASKLKKLSGERIRDEFFKILMVPDPVKILINMQECGILSIFLPEASTLRRLGHLNDLEKRISSVKDIMPNKLRRLAALFDPKINDTSLSSAMERLKLPNYDRSFLRGIINPEIESLTQMDKSQLLKLLRKFGPSQTRDLILLEWANNLMSSTTIPKSQTNTYISLLEKCTAWKSPRFPLTGTDALNLGVIEGPIIGAILASGEEWWERNGYTADRQKCLERMDLEVHKSTKKI